MNKPILLRLSPDPKLVRPSVLTIDGNASCQLRCPGCPTTGNGYPPAVGSGRLTLRDFDGLLRETPEIHAVHLENRGELFLNPELRSIVECAYRHGVRVHSYSGANLNHVREGVAEGLVRYRFRALVCAIDGATPETYRTYRVGGDLNRVLENVREINRYKRAYRSPYPKLTWQFVVFGHNEHEIPLVKKMAAELNMGVRFKMAWDSGYSPIRDKAFVIAETGWNAATREDFEKLNGASYVRSICYSLWQSPHVNWDGRILGCCWNCWDDFGGNAFREGYIRAANNETIRYARRMLLGQAAPKDGIPCASCELYRAMRESGKYLSPGEVLPRRRDRLKRLVRRALHVRKVKSLVARRGPRRASAAA